MESQSPQNAPLPATAPEWAAYYKQAKATRRLGRGQHARIQTESKRRKRQANLIALASTALLVAIVAICAALLGNNAASVDEPHGGGAAAPSRPADVRRG
jgi:hypothetical protein